MLGESSTAIEEIYQRQSLLEHFLLHPNTFVGSVEKNQRVLWIFEKGRINKRSISYVPGLYRIFDEVLINAADNARRNTQMNSIKVSINVEQNEITVFNNGVAIPIEIHQGEGVYVPELIFGNLLTSGNYQNSAGGNHGYGAKLANIFSTQFTVDIANGFQSFRQVFKDNMREKFPPEIGNCKSDDNWMVISFSPDLLKFGVESLEDDLVALMKKRVVDLGGCLGKSVQVFLDEELVPPTTFQEYVDLYLPHESSESEPLRIYERVNEHLEFVLSMSDDGHLKQVSFVNYIATINGGTHVDCITNQIAKHVVEVIKTQVKDAKLEAQTVKNCLWVFVNALIDKPTFQSQSKDTLTTPERSFGFPCVLSSNFLQTVENSDIVKKLLTRVQKNKEHVVHEKIDGRGKVNAPKYEEAFFAGKERIKDCTLILTEGISAMSLAMSVFHVLGSDYFGVYPIKGKFLNTKKATSKKLDSYIEIQNISRLLGLQQGRQYSDTKSLRYDHLMMMTDQDPDGAHIKGLVISFFHSSYPSLLKIDGFLQELITPVVKATNERTTEVRSFYTTREYEDWKENAGVNLKDFEIVQYKSLARSSFIEGAEYFADLARHKKNFVWKNEEDGDAIEEAFSQNKVEQRKNWVQHQQLQKGTYIDSEKEDISYKDFIKKDHMFFIMAQLQRSIPSLVDGLKTSQRKVLFSAFKKPIDRDVKVLDFSGYVSENAAYHHGDSSLVGTIIGMAQNFMGSNNINLLYPSGQFGTRRMGGKDHASGRYICTKLAPITRHLFHTKDELLLTYLTEDGHTIEPKWYLPVIPMALVNGVEGITTGYKTSVPCYNPMDIIDNIVLFLHNKTWLPMIPWYRSFKGSIESTSWNKVEYTSTGIVIEKQGGVIIKELPVRVWLHDYKQFLNSAAVKTKNREPLCEGYRVLYEDNTEYFDVSMTEGQLKKARDEEFITYFGLTKKISANNMRLLDLEGNIKKYGTPEEILYEFCTFRRDYYLSRKVTLQLELEKAEKKLTYKLKYIEEILTGEFDVTRTQNKDELVAELKKKSYPMLPDDTTGESYDYLLLIPGGAWTYEEMAKLKSVMALNQAEQKRLRETDPENLWLMDLQELEFQIKIQNKKDADEIEKIRRLKEKASGKEFVPVVDTNVRSLAQEEREEHVIWLSRKLADLEARLAAVSSSSQSQGSQGSPSQSRGS